MPKTGLKRCLKLISKRGVEKMGTYLFFAAFIYKIRGKKLKYVSERIHDFPLISHTRDIRVYAPFQDFSKAFTSVLCF